MDLFDQWDGDQALSPDVSPTRLPRAGGGAAAFSRGGTGDEFGTSHDIFSLRRVDWTAAGSRGGYRGSTTRSIRHAVVQSSIMVLATTDCFVIRWSVDSASDPEEIEISRRAEDKIYKLFLDPTGNHLVIAMDNGDNYYLHSRSTRPKKLKSWQGQAGLIESIAFDKFYGREASTKSILVGDNRGQLFETGLEYNNVKERPLNRVYEFDQPLPIRGLQFELLNTPSSSSSSSSDAEPRMLVLAATCNPVRLYKFLGGPPFEALFARHRDSGHMSFQELGGSPSFTSTELHLFSPSLDQQSYSILGSSSSSQYLALLTETGIYHGKLALSPPPSSADADILRDTSMFITDGSKDVPLSMGLSEFHFLLLFAKKLQVVSKLNGKVIQENPLDTAQGGIMKALIRDSAAGSFWLYSDRSIFQVIVRDEDRDVWRLYLDKALESQGTGVDTTRNFEAAYQYCKDPKDRAQVHLAQAAYYFRNGQYELAAKYYAMTPSSFEEVALKFVDDGQENALCVFLLEKLERLGGGGGGGLGGPMSGGMGGGGGAEVKAQYKTQRVMLCTWLTEIFLKRIASLEGPGKESSHRDTVDEFQSFLRTHIDDLRIHPPTTYDLLASYGRKEELLLYATLIEDLDRVIASHIQERNFTKALQVLESAPFERVESFFYKYSYTLMDAEPTRTVAAWMSKPGLNPTRLIPALVRYLQRRDSITTTHQQAVDGGGVNLSMAIQYLEHCATNSKGHADPAIYNYLLQLYAQQPDDKDLLRFLVTTCEKDAETRRYGSSAAASPRHGPPLDLKYALRVCTHHQKTRACVQIYSFMELYEEAVELALRVDVGLAKENADKPRSDEVKKRLWLTIAKHLIEVVKIKVKDAIALLDECPLLQIEDILPFFPDFVVIDDFKPEICKSLQEYSEKIKSLKSEMEDYTQSTTEIEKKITELKSRHLPLLPNQPCMLCDLPVFTQQFYLFPCRHAFHSECLAPHVLPHLSAVQRRGVRDLQEALAAELASITATGANPRKAAQVDALQTEIDGYLAAECPLCGDFMIRSVTERLIIEEEEAKEWETN